MLKYEKGKIQLYTHEILQINQVIYTTYSNCMPDIMILAQAVLKLICSQVSFTVQSSKVGKGR